jgi:hypothetical protein
LALGRGRTFVQEAGPSRRMRLTAAMMVGHAA